MLNLGKELEQEYGTHRAGWAYAVSCLGDYHDEHGPDFISFLEKKFVFGSDVGDFSNQFSQPDRPWVGVVHCPVQVPIWFNRHYSPEVYFKTEAFVKAQELCAGLISLSTPLTAWLHENVDVPITTLLHPTEACEKQFDEAMLLEDKPLKVVQLGFWLRKLHAIHQLKLSSTDFKKFTVGSSRPHQSRVINIEKNIFNVKPETVRDVKQVGFLDNTEYDNLLAESVVFVDFYDTSANNAIIECVVRGTPVICPPLKAIVDYLGPQYPLYFRDKDEAEEILKDRDRLIKGSRYLKYSGIASKLSLEQFKSDFANINYKG
ncbi:hypothetical protein Q4561_12650 [Alteromonas sp. 1_MG-2023]|uniref:hypothetical protein n=1 Tax=Alteromonas sp. 1_MG-2023 TaxID=3062669 RepID=UPI0026E34840|nr:hypothetical protein [Alteromonas sp. 1_MG-2023]MDO6567913.1 hypothetical protein [Alteromonas sp. 1_MG-2023]